MSPFLNCTVGEILAENARKNPHGEALVYSDRDLRFTYAELDSRVNDLAKGLLSLGVKKGDHVGIWATNVPDWIPLFFAASRVGAVFIPINTSYRPHELEYVLKQSDTKVLIIIDGYRDVDYVNSLFELIPELKTTPRGRLASERFPFLKEIVYLGSKQHRGMHSLSELIAQGSNVADQLLEEITRSITPQDMVNMQYTSGTTGFPRGVMLTHFGILNNGFQIGSRQNYSEKDRLCLPVPLFHCFGITLGAMAIYTHGGTLCPLEYFDPLMTLAVVQKERCTALYGVPTMFIAELHHSMFNMFDLRSLRTGIMAGSICPEPLMREVVERMFMREITVVYGLTEASPGITQTATDDSMVLRVSTVGRPFDGVEVKIIDPETRKELGPNIPGELCSRGYNTMKGYYKMPEETAKVIDADGWLHTGDIAVHDGNGYYRITSRLKDMIIRGGENIYPKEVEDFLLLMPEIKNAQIVAVPSEKYGEEVAAFIELKDGKSIEAEDVQDYCRGQIARYKIPKYIFFVDDFPLTASGKIQKFKLREQAVRNLGL
jgi:fatty-acyl-CoA synthase